MSDEATATRKTRKDYTSLSEVYSTILIPQFREDIKAVFAQGGISSQAALLRAYNLLKGCEVSPSEFSAMLDSAGVKFQRSVSLQA